MNFILKALGWILLIYGGFGVVNSLLGSHFLTTIFDVCIVVGGRYLIKWSKKREISQLNAISAKELDDYNRQLHDNQTRQQDYHNKVSDIIYTNLGCKAEKILWDGQFLFLGIDYEKENICIVDVDSPKLLKFNDIIKVELMEKTELSGGGGHISVNNGIGGGKISSISSTTIYSIKIIVNDRQHPVYTANCNSNNDADDWYGTLTAITSKP